MCSVHTEGRSLSLPLIIPSVLSLGDMFQGQTVTLLVEECHYAIGRLMHVVKEDMKLVGVRGEDYAVLTVLISPPYLYHF